MPVKLKHLTFTGRALAMLECGEYFSGNTVGHYDAGMNFLGVLGLQVNYFPDGAPDAVLCCEWVGAVSTPFRFQDLPKCKTPNVLYDFNGSGENFPNNDPRYFLLYGSEGVRGTDFSVPDDDEVVRWWGRRHGVAWLVSLNRALKRLRISIQPWLIRKARADVNELRKRYWSGERKLRITQRDPNRCR